MWMLRSVLIVLAVVMTLDSRTIAADQPPTPPPPQNEFVPIDELPPQDQLPAAPLLISAYVIVLAVLFGYLVSLARRMSVLQREMRDLESRIGRSRRE